MVVLAKSPQPGQVKTRLQPAFSPEEAAALAAAAIRDTLDVVAELGPRSTVVAWDGAAVPWLPRGVSVMRQRGRGLDERLEHVFEDVLASAGDGPALLVGMDTPQLRPADLDVEWDGHDAVLGPAGDGGFWAIGMRRHVPGAILGTPMSTADTGARQLARLRAKGLDVGVLPLQRDVDEPADAAAVAALAPWTRFARLHQRLVDAPCAPTALFDAALGGSAVDVRDTDAPAGSGRPGLPAVVDGSTWADVSLADEVLLSRCEGPVLDIGCGPGRFVEALARRGIPALGVDLSSVAVERTRGRGAPALVRDALGPLPAEGRWATVLLADGNIGIGGDPLALLRRCHALLRPLATALVETSTGEDWYARRSVTLHGPHGRRSAPLAWAVVGARALRHLAALAGFAAAETWQVGGRTFVLLRRTG
jgi:rSAM/selenodomain-associated transferase 1